MRYIIYASLYEIRMEGAVLYMRLFRKSYREEYILFMPLFTRFLKRVRYMSPIGWEYRLSFSTINAPYWRYRRRYWRQKPPPPRGPPRGRHSTPHNFKLWLAVRAARHALPARWKSPPGSTADHRFLCLRRRARSRGGGARDASLCTSSSSPRALQA